MFLPVPTHSASFPGMSSTTHERTELPLPPFYRPEHAAFWGYRPDQQALFEQAIAWRRELGLTPASEDEVRVHLLLVDLQKDFCFPEGSLYVGGRSGEGAIRDNDRTARFIYSALGVITQITCTMDTHFPHQIFSPSFWLTEEGTTPVPHREVRTADVRAGHLRPNPALAPYFTAGNYERLWRQAVFYCEELEKSGKYTLYLWPPHCILGSAGHALAGVVHEARMFHAFARVAPNDIEMKGDNPLTENYSVLSPEVRSWFDGVALAERNTAFIARLRQSDAVVIAGQAASHCVKHTIDDLLGSIDERLVRKIYILRDCMSSVAVPDPSRQGEFLFDFTPQAEAALGRFADAGMHVVDSTTPIREWPDFPVAG
jgi:nicotinamidase-related amidase